MSVPNQRIVLINKDNQQKAPFVCLNLDVVGMVYKDLKGAHAFYLYLCLCGNENKRKLEFSPQYYKDKFGLPISTTQDQFKKLQAKGYLVPIKEGSNHYNFYAEPPHITEAIANMAEEQKQEMLEWEEEQSSANPQVTFNF